MCGVSQLKAYLLTHTKAVYGLCMVGEGGGVGTIMHSVGRVLLAGLPRSLSQVWATAAKYAAAEGAPAHAQLQGCLGCV